MNIQGFFRTLVLNEGRRAIAKTVTWRVVATVVTGVVVYLFTGEFAEASKATLVAAVVLTILYYFHEEFWARILAHAVRREGHPPADVL